MSAANRGSDRHPQDAYITPLWAVERLLDVNYPLAINLAPGAAVLDPCAARGELLSVVKRRLPEVSINALELRQECATGLEKVVEGNLIIGDALQLLKTTPDKAFDLVLTNPPYSLANEFLTECRRIAKVTIFLQRINWIRGEGRDRLMAQASPGLFVLPQRPSFTGYGQDATEYAFFSFDNPTFSGTWRMLDRTPDIEIAAHNARARELNPWAKKHKNKEAA